jgi:hypothetical protein
MSREKSGGISVTTLLIASASAAAAAIVVPMIWAGGGVVAAAITPVIVTLVSESLKHPVTKVQEAGVWRKTPSGTAVRQPAGRDFDPVDPEEERIEVDPGPADDPFGLYEEERGSFFTKKKVTIALATGAVAFLIAAVVVTAGELTFSSDSKPSQTTFFGGNRSSTPTPTPTPTATEDGEEKESPTPTPSATETPSATATPNATASATPSASAAPNSAAPPATQEATPAPTP